VLKKEFIVIIIIIIVIIVIIIIIIIIITTTPVKLKISPNSRILFFLAHVYLTTRHLFRLANSL